MKNSNLVELYSSQIDLLKEKQLLSLATDKMLKAQYYLKAILK
jgi:hypothetical protein